MFNRRSLLFTACACVVFASGCGQSTPPSATDATAATEPGTPADGAPAVPAGPTERINPAVVFTATPNPADFCNDKNLTTVTVNWDVSAANTPIYSVWVEAPSIPRKAWMSGSKPVDSAQTGLWVRDQTKFTLVDNTGTVIAATTVTGADCGAPAEAAPAPADAAPANAPPAG